MIALDSLVRAFPYLLTSCHCAHAIGSAQVRPGFSWVWRWNRRSRWPPTRRFHERPTGRLVRVCFFAWPLGHVELYIPIWRFSALPSISDCQIEVKRRKSPTRRERFWSKSAARTYKSPSSVARTLGGAFVCHSNCPVTRCHRNFLEKCPKSCFYLELRAQNHAHFHPFSTTQKRRAGGSIEEPLEYATAPTHHPS